MSYLNVDLTYFEHRKTKRLIGLLGRGSEVLPLKLWAYCGRAHPVDGSLADYTDQEIESLVGWWGQSGRFVSAMVTVGLIDDVDGKRRVHEWEEHQGHIAAFHERAKKGAKVRWEKIKGDASSIATSIAKTEPKQSPKPNLLNQPTNPDAGGSVPGQSADTDPASAVDDSVRVATPRHLRTNDFYAALGRWMLARDTKPSPIVIREQLSWLGQRTNADAIAACLHSARGGYKSIVDPKTNGKPAKQNAASGDWAKKPYCPDR